MEKNYTIGKLTQGLNYKKREREKLGTKEAHTDHRKTTLIVLD